jgi:hypothetical protein
MRRAEHDRIVREKDRTIARLERQNEDLLNRLMYVSKMPWEVPPVEVADAVQLDIPLVYEDVGPELIEELEQSG